jgi:purine catabolism regulator
MVLEEVVPFAVISKEVNTLILDQETQALRLADRTTRAVHDALVAQSSLAGVIQIASTAAGMPMVVVTAAGRVVAASGDRVTPGPLPTPSTPGVVLADIVTMGRPWGTLIVEPQGFHSAIVAEAVAVRTASAVGVAVMQTTVAGSDAESVAAALLNDLLDDDTTVREQDLLIRGGLVGFAPRPGQSVIGVALDPSDTSVAATVNAAVTNYGGVAACGPALGAISALVTAPRGVPDPAGFVVEALREAAVNVGLRDPAGVVGPVVPLGQAARSLRQAHDRLALVRNPARLVDSRELVLAAALRSQSSGELHSLVTDVLGPLQEWDARNSTDLILTLHLYLRLGQSATAVAQALHLRRQTVHQRLARIETLLYRTLDDPSMVEALVAATAAHRIIGN